jgi:hypothetical protein
MHGVDHNLKIGTIRRNIPHINLAQVLPMKISHVKLTSEIGTFHMRNFQIQ